MFVLIEQVQHFIRQNTKIARQIAPVIPIERAEQTPRTPLGNCAIQGCRPVFRRLLPQLGRERACDGFQPVIRGPRKQGIDPHMKLHTQEKKKRGTQHREVDEEPSKNFPAQRKSAFDFFHRDEAAT